jgi:hypothetical protein
MASTRNINTKGNYILENRQYESAKLYNTYKHSPYGESYQHTLPNIGITPSRLPRTAFSSNYTDIESMLRGIGSTNMVNKSFVVEPQLKSLNTESFVDRIPLIMPEKLLVEPKQRPNY